MRFSALLLSLIFVGLTVQAQEAAKAKAPAKKAPLPMLAPITDVPGLPRVLLIVIRFRWATRWTFERCWKEKPTFIEFPRTAVRLREA